MWRLFQTSSSAPNPVNGSLGRGALVVLAVVGVGGVATVDGVGEADRVAWPGCRGRGGPAQPVLAKAIATRTTSRIAVVAEGPVQVVLMCAPPPPPEWTM